MKVSRLIKRRTVANEACDASKVAVNGKTAKPAHDLKVGDVITLSLGGKTVQIEVLLLTEHAPKADASEMYRVIG